MAINGLKIIKVNLFVLSTENTDICLKTANDLKKTIKTKVNIIIIIIIITFLAAGKSVKEK